MATGSLLSKIMGTSICIALMCSTQAKAKDCSDVFKKLDVSYINELVRKDAIAADRNSLYTLNQRGGTHRSRYAEELRSIADDLASIGTNKLTGDELLVAKRLEHFYFLKVYTEGRVESAIELIQRKRAAQAERSFFFAKSGDNLIISFAETADLAMRMRSSIDPESAKIIKESAIAQGRELREKFEGLILGAKRRIQIIDRVMEWLEQDYRMSGFDGGPVTYTEWVSENIKYLQSR